MIQNHSSITLFVICVHRCLMNIFTKFCLPTVFQKLSCGSLISYIKMCTTSHKITEVLINCVYALNKNTNQILIPSMFQSCDTEQIPPILVLHLHFTKLPNRDNIYKMKFRIPLHVKQINNIVEYCHA